MVWIPHVLTNGKGPRTLHQQRLATLRKKVVEEEDLPPPVYATQEEAVDAFKALLTDKRVRNPFNKPISHSCNLLYTFSIEIIDLKYCVLDADIASYYSLFIEFYQFSSSTANEFIDSL